MTCGAGGESSADGAQSQAFNPPMVHAVATLPDAAAGGLGHVVAVARGDGVAAVLDVRAPQRRAAGQRGGPPCPAAHGAQLCTLRPALRGYAVMSAV